MRYLGVMDCFLCCGRVERTRVREELRDFRESKNIGHDTGSPGRSFLKSIAPQYKGKLDLISARRENKGIALNT